MEEYERLRPLGTDFRMANMLRELSDCIRTMPNVNGDHMHILTVENKFQTQSIVVQHRAKGRNCAADEYTSIPDRDSDLI